MAADAEVVNATVVEDPAADTPPTEDQPAPVPGVELVHRPEAGQSTALIVADTAKEKVAIATEIATQLDQVIKTQGLRTKMGRRKKVLADGSEEWSDGYHVNVEGWQTLATFLDLAVVPLEPRPVMDPETGRPRLTEYTVEKLFYPKGTKRDQIRSGSADVERVERAQIRGYDWQCRVEVFKAGTIIAAATAICSRAEESWRDRDEHALASMAQTRAIGKAIAGAARWIVTLAGYQATPAEEMPKTPDAPQDAPQAPAAAPYGPPLDPARKAQVMAAIRTLVEVGAADDAEVAKAVAGSIAKTAGGMPAIVGQALVIAADALSARRGALEARRAQDTAAEDEPPTEDGSGDHDTATTPPPAPPKTLPEIKAEAAAIGDPAKRAAYLRQHGCTCEKPGAPPEDDGCAIHGIPF